MSARLPTYPILIAMGGMAVLCAMDAVIKDLGGTYAIVTIAFGRYLVGTACAFLVYVAAGRPALTPEMMRAHAGRGLVTAAAACLFYWALALLPLAEAVTLSFVAPLLIPVIAWLLLGERLRMTSVVAGLTGFIGVLIATEGEAPAVDGTARMLGTATALAAAVAYALAIVLLRGRAARDGPAIVGLMNAAVPALILTPFMLVFGTLPQPEALPWFVLLGLLGTAGIHLLSLAYARAEAQVLAPVEFTALGWAALLGYVLFDERPSPQGLMGAGVIIAACLFAAWDERRRARLVPTTAG